MVSAEMLQQATLKLRHSPKPTGINTIRSFFEEPYQTKEGKKCPPGKRLSKNNRCIRQSFTPLKI